MEPQAPTTNPSTETESIASSGSDRFVQTPKNNSKKTLALILMTISLVLVIGGLIYFLGQKSTETNDSSPTPEDIIVDISTPTPQSSPSAISTPKSQERSELGISILNGTGIPKEASFLQDILKKMGYSKFELGNAETANYSDTEVTFASSVSEAIKAEITAKLEETYRTVKVVKGTASQAGVKIITGLKKGAIVSPTPKASATIKATPTAKPSSTASVSPTASSTATPAPTN